jgi:hypothetical protein
MKRKVLLVFSLVAILSVLSASLVFAAMKGQDVDLASARIGEVYPQVVAPGLLVSISGKGFGEIPGKITIGDIVVDEFVSWNPRIIWLRIPEGVKDGDKIKVGDVTSDSLTLAPAGSTKVIWKVNVDKAQRTITTNARKYKVPEDTTMQTPLYIKGQWIKNGAKAGNFDGGWDGGSRRPMAQEDPSVNVWTAEYLFTPGNVSTFSIKAFAFALEDANIKDRRLSPFESDAACVIKKEWATDIKPGAGDPVVNFTDAADGVVFVGYGVK